MKKVAVILSGCGVFDGSEIYETVITLLALDSHDAQYQCFAPNTPQLHVIDHLKGDIAVGETRNVLVEAARLARGEIKDLADLNEKEFDAIIFPGGFGAAKNLSDFAVNGASMVINLQVKAAARAFALAKKPAGYICIAPTLIAGIYEHGAECTIGNDPDTAAAINTMGAKHINCEVDDVVIDEKNKIVSTPAYMLAERISEAAAGIEKLVGSVLNMTDAK
ncbi:isoprenoid biosynthesis glyoxalase ElbB [Alkalimarinus alittae]|uniref:Glyoxalase n=1 Tax=Alkalimarinus alittae TaxID=2961619 RepID=A0ABY6MY54_9ALTE|nr:isoprenoid biosynthesis glyoxalase ElbB [Alkalimarinus alittae]UZE94754.1 isoprenoid biosynthesis glyoxalase ElbB [Alkalimarinus alittae]